MILFTSDTDFAEDFVLDFFFNLINSFNVPWVIFATNYFERFETLRKKGFEIGIHPNFIPCKNREEMISEVEKLKRIFPDARYSRSHSIMSGGPIWDALKTNQITYDFSYFHPYTDILAKRKLWNDLIQIQYNWEDDYHFHIKEFEKNDIERIQNSKQIIVDFHPIHVYLNTKNKKDYLEYLKFKHDKEMVEKFHKENWKYGYGCGNFLLEILENQEIQKVINIQDYIQNMHELNYHWG